MLESKFQSSLIEELKNSFPGCIILKNDSGYIQGIPDLTILYKNKWATLECKKNKTAPHRPNQDYYVDLMNFMSFSAFIYPENKEEIIMNLKTFFWHDNAKKFKKDSHAIFGASNYHWINYSDDKMIETFTNNEAKKKGTELHEIACSLIKNKIKLPDIKATLNMYVNDSIFYNMRPEEQLYYSEWFFGTADAISLENKILRVFDLKTGKTKASIHQLEVYVAFWCLEYNVLPTDLKDIVLRIYQNNEIIEDHPDSDVIIHIMDKIISVTNVLEKLKEDESYE